MDNELLEGGAPDGSHDGRLRIRCRPAGRHHGNRRRLGDDAAARTAQAIALGACVGFVVGLTSAGSGALIAVGLVLWFRLKPPKVVGTDLFHASIVLWAAAIAHVFAGDIDYGLAGTLLVGAIPGVIVSTQISLRAPQGVLRAALAVVLLGAGLAMLSKAGVAVPSYTLAIAPALVIGLVAGAVLKERGGARPLRHAHVRA